MSTNWSAGLNAGIQGAQLGGQVGGAWGALIGGGLGFILGADSPSSKDVIKKYNNEVVKLHAQDLFKLQAEQNYEAMRTAKALLAYQDNQRVAQSSYNAQYGAADIIGSSADAMAQVLDFQTSEAKAAVRLNWEIGVDNYNTMVDQISNQRQASLKRFDDKTPIDFKGLVKGGLEGYKAYRQAGSLSNLFGSGDSNNVTGSSSFLGSFTKGGNQTSTVLNKIL